MATIPPPLLATDHELVQKLIRRILDCSLLVHSRASVLTSLVYNMRCADIGRTILDMDDQNLYNLALLIRKGMTQLTGQTTRDIALAQTLPLFRALTNFESDREINLSRNRNHTVRQKTNLRQNELCLLSRDNEVEVCHIIPHAASMKKRLGSSYWLLIGTMFGREITDNLWQTVQSDTTKNTILLAPHWHASWDRGAMTLLPQPDQNDDYIDLTIYNWAPDMNWAGRKTDIPLNPEDQNAHGEQRLMFTRMIRTGDKFRIWSNGYDLPCPHLLRVRATLYDFLRSAGHLKLYRPTYEPPFMTASNQSPASEHDEETQGGLEATRSSAAARNDQTTASAPSDENGPSNDTKRRRHESSEFEILDREVMMEDWQRQQRELQWEHDDDDEEDDDNGANALDEQEIMMRTADRYP